MGEVQLGKMLLAEDEFSLKAGLLRPWIPQTNSHWETLILLFFVIPRGCGFFDFAQKGLLIDVPTAPPDRPSRPPRRPP
jgi:hypothetical protein